MQYGFDLALAILFTGAAAFAGYKLSFKASLAVLLQLFVLALLCQWRLLLCIALPVAFAAARTLRLTIKHGGNARTRSYELMLRNLELRKTRLQIVHGDEVERRLLAADLHDQVLNDLKITKQKFVDYKQNPSVATATQIESLLAAAMEEIHEVMDNLCPSVLEHLGLTAAVDELLRTACKRSGIKRQFKSELAEPDLCSFSSTQQALLYRLIQESVTNACKHAQGKTLAVSMAKEEKEIVIRITDDGKGMFTGNSHDRTSDNAGSGDTRGIRYMKQRAELIGAKISWRSVESPGNGTEVEIRLPLT